MITLCLTLQVIIHFNIQLECYLLNVFAYYGRQLKNTYISIHQKYLKISPRNNACKLVNKKSLPCINKKQFFFELKKMYLNQ